MRNAAQSAMISAITTSEPILVTTTVQVAAASSRLTSRPLAFTCGWRCQLMLNSDTGSADRPMASSHKAFTPPTRIVRWRNCSMPPWIRSGINSAAPPATTSMALATAPPIPAMAPLSGLRMANTKASTALAAYHVTA